VLAAALLAGAGPRPALAHDQPFSYMDLEVLPSRLELRVTVHDVDAAAALGAAHPESLLSARYVASRRERLAGFLVSRIGVGVGDRDLGLRGERVEIKPDQRAVVTWLRGDWPRPPGALRLRVRSLSGDAQHQIFLNVYQAGRLLGQDVLTADRPDAEVFTSGREGALAVIARFVPLGIHHIFIGPDHILFIVGLVLLGGGIGRVLKTVTGFTLAHSITLAAATLGLVSPPARIVEPLIALSVLYVGASNLRANRGGADARTWIAFAFGLVHGFGFAGVLREFGLPREALGWSLFSFNVGVEIGQASIVLAVTPLLTLLRARTPEVAVRTVRFASWGVLLAGGWWFLQRAFLAG
jgi:hydrogenase/urease accessory protein HupE